MTTLLTYAVRQSNKVKDFLNLAVKKGNIHCFDTFSIQKKRDTGKSSIPLVAYIKFVRYSTAQTACWLCFLVLTESETLIHDISERGKLVLALGAIDTIRNGHEPHIMLQEKFFCVVADLPVIAAQTG